ncbi:MAG: NADH:ubiquinone reductase (Na(+)-transporting) subunit D [Flavobacteriaceae bacterium]|nr:NADH:ubiquinone reductase (Na(+)-transporting) subunit D [Flavobacteriaceae bacterium]|tara:strand:+ start:3555 stop:4145 length:591 start_codon:yes stop_codon:yes gene_type:complete
MNKKIFIDPLIDNNPISRQVLGICSALAVTVKLEQAFVMTFALTFVVTMSNVIISLLRNYIPSSIRIIVQLTVISSLVTLIDKALAAYMYDLSKSLSVFIALIVTNCIVMGRADGFAMQNNVKNSFLDGLGNGLGYGMMLILVAFFRELFGFGTVFDFRILPEVYNNGLMILAPGAFIILGLIIWAQRSLTSFVEE